MGAIERVYLDDPNVLDQTIQHHCNRYAFAIENVDHKGRVLDIACGSGYGTDMLRTAGFTSTEGVDIDADAVAYAQKNFPLCTFSTSDAENLSLSPDTYALITFFEALEHVSRNIGLQVFEKVANALEPKGTFFVSTPRDIKADTNSYHITQWTIPELEEALRPLFSTIALFGQDWETGEISKELEGHDAFYIYRCIK